VWQWKVEPLCITPWKRLDVSRGLLNGVIVENRGDTIGGPRSVSSTTSSTLGQLNMLRMTNTEMSGEGIIPAESFLLGAQVTANLLLARVMDRVFVAREIVWS